ncbi:MAG: DUF3558 domain-containing protein [Thermocrispum sp.]
MNRPKLLTSCYISAATLFVLAACGSEPPSASEGPQAGGDSNLPHSGAPAVASPLELGKFESSPCEILGPRQLASIDLKNTQSTEDKQPPGPTCSYSRSDAPASAIAVSFLTSDTQGLSRLYQNETVDSSAYFEEVRSVSGHPGVLTGLTDNRDQGDCSLVVGVRDDLVMQIVVTGHAGGDPCELATAVGRLAVDRLKAAN